MKREELLETVYRLRLLIFTEELSKCKKEALNYLDLYTYRVNAIPGGQFDETLRFFNVVRRKNHNNDNDTSFSGLPGSRCQRSNSKFKLSGLLLSSSKIVNTSTGTDRKRKKTDSLTSNYQ